MMTRAHVSKPTIRWGAVAVLAMEAALLGCAAPANELCPSGEASCPSSSNLSATPEALKPKVTFLEPQQGSVLQGFAHIRGTARDATGQPLPVVLSLDGQLLETLPGEPEWGYRLDTRTLPEGSHTLTATATDGGGRERSESLEVVTKRLELGACPEGTLQMQFFKNEWLAGAPRLVRCEALPLVHDWGEGAPDGTTPADVFTASWQGDFAVTAGSWVVRGKVDDGIRVWLDGELIVDQWRSQPSLRFEASRTLAAGRHALRVEYWEVTGAALVELEVVRAP